MPPVFAPGFVRMVLAMFEPSLVGLLLPFARLFLELIGVAPVWIGSHANYADATSEKQPDPRRPPRHFLFIRPPLSIARASEAWLPRMRSSAPAPAWG